MKHPPPRRVCLKRISLEVRRMRCPGDLYVRVPVNEGGRSIGRASSAQPDGSDWLESRDAMRSHDQRRTRHNLRSFEMAVLPRAVRTFKFTPVNTSTEF